MQACLLAMPCIPWLVFLGLGLSWLLGYDARERTVAFLTNFGSLVSLLAAVVLIASMMTAGVDSVSIGFGQWFSIGNYHFPMVFFVDWLFCADGRAHHPSGRGGIGVLQKVRASGEGILPVFSVA